MESLPNLRRQHRWALIIKDIDQIHDSIKNFDDIIYKTKNFCLAFWGGSLFLITQHLDKASEQEKATLIFLSAGIPLLFWVMDYRWRKHLLQCSRRERILSHFLNSDAFEKLVLEGEKDLAGKQFPLYDTVGWIYITTAEQEVIRHIPAQYLVNPREIKGWKVLFYKDAKWFYSAMIAVSVIFGFFSQP